MERAGYILHTVENDFWVCWVLDLLFHLPTCGVELTLKGGTSLLKGWQIINRFSEDIDIVINKGILGFSGENSPRKRTYKQSRGKTFKTIEKGLSTVHSRHS